MKNVKKYRVLCLFGGFLGAHRWYTGQYGTAIIYMFTGGLLFVGVISDFILAGYNVKRQNAYLRRRGYIGQSTDILD